MYIGSTTRKNAGRRWTTHKVLLNNNKHFNKKLQMSWNKYSTQNFEYIILDTVNKDVREYEQRWITAFWPNCYNISSCVKAPMQGRKHSKEAKYKMSLAGKGKIKSETHL